VKWTGSPVRIPEAGALGARREAAQLYQGPFSIKPLPLCAVPLAWYPDDRAVVAKLKVANDELRRSMSPSLQFVAAQ
jgi:hypothetical protein